MVGRTVVGKPRAPTCRCLRLDGAARSPVSHHRARGERLGCRPGPATEISDDGLVDEIREMRTDSPLAQEGDREVRARLRREHRIGVGEERLLRLMRRHGLLAWEPSESARLLPRRDRQGARRRRGSGAQPPGRRAKDERLPARVLSNAVLDGVHRVRDGTTIPDGPDRRRGTDATMARTSTDGRVWTSGVVDRSTAEAWCRVAESVSAAPHSNPGTTP